METFVDRHEDHHRCPQRSRSETTSRMVRSRKPARHSKHCLHIMAYGEYEGKGLDSEEVRGLFTRESMLNSDWYKARLESQQEQDIKSWTAHVDYLNTSWPSSPTLAWHSASTSKPPHRSASTNSSESAPRLHLANSSAHLAASRSSSSHAQINRHARPGKAHVASPGLLCPEHSRRRCSHPRVEYWSV